MGILLPRNYPLDSSCGNTVIASQKVETSFYKDLTIDQQDLVLFHLLHCATESCILLAEGCAELDEPNVYIYYGPNGLGFVYSFHKPSGRVRILQILGSDIPHMGILRLRRQAQMALCPENATL